MYVLIGRTQIEDHEIIQLRRIEEGSEEPEAQEPEETETAAGV